MTPLAEAPVRRCSRSDSASSGIVGFPRPSAVMHTETFGQGPQSPGFVPDLQLDCKE